MTLIKDLLVYGSVFCPLTNFELYLVNKGKKGGGGLSTLYKILLTSVPLCDRLKSYWERDLNITLSDMAWYKIQEFNLSFSVNVATKENRYQLLNRCYLTPIKLAQMSPQPESCWRCGQDKVHYFHMWWICPKLQIFLSQVGQVISQIIGAEVPVDP